MVDRTKVRDLVDRGGLLRVALPSAGEEGVAKLLSDIRGWLSETSSSNGQLESEPALKFLKYALEERERSLASQPADSEE